MIDTITLSLVWFLAVGESLALATGTIKTGLARTLAVFLLCASVAVLTAEYLH